MVVSVLESRLGRIYSEVGEYDNGKIRIAMKLNFTVSRCAMSMSDKIHAALQQYLQ